MLIIDPPTGMRRHACFLRWSDCIVEFGLSNSSLALKSRVSVVTGGIDRPVQARAFFMSFLRLSSILCWMCLLSARSPLHSPDDVAFRKIV